MKYNYRINQVDWKDEKQKEKWFSDALTRGHTFDYVITETINDTEEFSFYLGDDIFDESKTFFSERDIRAINWVKENHPEIFI